MKNKILITITALLAAALIFENAYLLGRRDARNPARVVKYQYIPTLAMAKASYDETKQIQERLDQAFRDRVPFSESQNFLKQNLFVQPGLDFKQTKDGYNIEVNLPGVKKEEINVQVTGRQLVISNKQKKEKQDNQAGISSSSYKVFFSSFLLPEDAIINQMKTDYKDNLLFITIPRAAKPKAGGGQSR